MHQLRVMSNLTIAQLRRGTSHDPCDSNPKCSDVNDFRLRSQSDSCGDKLKRVTMSCRNCKQIYYTRHAKETTISQFCSKGVCCLFYVWSLAYSYALDCHASFFYFHNKPAEDELCEQPYWSRRDYLREPESFVDLSVSPPVPSQPYSEPIMIGAPMLSPVSTPLRKKVYTETVEETVDEDSLRFCNAYSALPVASSQTEVKELSPKPKDNVLIRIPRVASWLADIF